MSSHFLHWWQHLAEHLLSSVHPCLSPWSLCQNPLWICHRGQSLRVGVHCGRLGQGGFGSTCVCIGLLRGLHVPSRMCRIVCSTHPCRTWVAWQNALPWVVQWSWLAHLWLSSTFLTVFTSWLMCLAISSGDCAWSCPSPPFPPFFL